MSAERLTARTETVPVKTNMPPALPAFVLAAPATRLDSQPITLAVSTNWTGWTRQSTDRHGMREGVVLVGSGTMYWWVGEWVGGFR